MQGRLGLPSETLPHKVDEDFAPVHAIPVVHRVGFFGEIGSGLIPLQGPVPSSPLGHRVETL
jgi:hypothetical protein